MSDPKEGSPLESVLKRDRALLIAGISGLALLSWGYMAMEAHAMYATGVCQCAGMAMSGPDMTSWSPAELAALFLMWTEMMVAMMLPSAAPMLLTFAMVNRKRREQEQPFVRTTFFLSGYLAIWTLFSAIAAAAQWLLHAKALLSPMMVSTSPALGGGILIAAGVFQWTPLKNACLKHCRTPLSFIMTNWREGRSGAFVMGLEHGAFCTGCCWFLMALLFVAGVMNILWIAVITLFVLLEKALPGGTILARVAGALLLGLGVCVFFGRIA